MEPLAQHPPLEKRYALALIVATLLIFARTLSFDWLAWDDGATARHAPFLHEEGGLLRIWTTLDAEQYYPLTFTTYWVEHRLFGDDASWFHATNVVLHALNVVLVWLLLRQWGQRSSLAWVGAALFAVHPSQVMSVAWISERKTLLAASFALLTLLLYCVEARSRRRSIAALLAYAAALLSKSAVLGLPAVLLVWEVSRSPRDSWRRLSGLIPFFLLSVAAIAPTWLSEQKFVESDSLPVSPLLHSLKALAWYSAQTLWPWPLTPMPGRFDDPSCSPGWIGGAILLVALVLIAVRAQSRRPRWFGLGSALFCALLLPILGWLPYGNLAVASVSDHYLYLPMVGAIVVILPAVDAVLGRGWRRPIAVSVLILATTLTWTYLPTFANTRAFSERILAFESGNFAAHFALGNEALTNRETERAREHFLAATAQKPREADAWRRLGEVFLFERRFDEAAAAFGQGLSHRPKDEALGIALGGLQLGRLQRESAEASFRRVLDSNPNSVRALAGLATALRGQNRDREAERLLTSAIDPHPSEVGLLLLLSQILSTSPDDTVRDGKRAMALCSQAQSHQPKPDLALLLTQAGCLAEVGRSEEAARLLENSGLALSEPEAAVLSARAAHFRTGKPWREIPRPSR